MGDGTFDPEAFDTYVLALAADPRTRKSAPNRTGFPGLFRSAGGQSPRQKHQVGRFLCFPEKRFARRAHFRTHGQTTDQVSDLARPCGYWKVRRDFSRADPVPERSSTIATPPAVAFCRNCRTSASSTSGATDTRRQPTGQPFWVALSTEYLRKLASESRRGCGEKIAFAARAPFFSAYALRTRRNSVRLPPKTYTGSADQRRSRAR